jgi:hypothetical protein
MNFLFGQEKGRQFCLFLRCLQSYMKGVFYHLFLELCSCKSSRLKNGGEYASLNVTKSDTQNRLMFHGSKSTKLCVPKTDLETSFLLHIKKYNFKYMS